MHLGWIFQNQFVPKSSSSQYSTLEAVCRESRLLAQRLLI